MNPLPSGGGRGRASRRLPLLCTAAALAAASLAGCSGGGSGKTPPASDMLRTLPDASLDNAFSMFTFARMGSAPAIAFAGVYPYQFFTAGDPSCPVVDEVDGVRNVRGGCTNDEGFTFLGNITAVDSSAGTIQYDDFTVLTLETCGGVAIGRKFVFNGEIRGQPLGSTFGTASDDPAGPVDFTADLRWDIDAFDDVTCVTSSLSMVWSYAGEAIPLAGEAKSWEGSGRVGVSTLGAVDVSTQGEQIDASLCAYEAITGSTTFESGAHSARVFYDGAGDCSPSQTATWTYDGTPQGTLEDLGCRAVPGTRNPGSFGLLVAISALISLMFRRRC